MSKIKEIGKQIGEALNMIDFSVSDRNHIALVKLPALMFSEYKSDGDREYSKGEVIRIGNNKYMLQNWGKIDPNLPPPQNPLCKLFRDARRYEWVREEFCLKGFQRYYDHDNPVMEGWYIVISEYADGSTPPPNDTQNWEKIID